MQTTDFRALGLGRPTILVGAAQAIVDRTLPKGGKMGWFAIQALSDCVFTGLKLHKDVVAANSYNITLLAGSVLLQVESVTSFVSGTAVILYGK